jgi:hypothetical protein
VRWSARDLYEKSIAASREVGDKRFEALEYLNSPFLELQAGNLEGASARVKASVEASALEEGDLPYVLLALGAIAARGGDGRPAAEMLAKAEAMLAEKGEVVDPGDKPLFDSARADAREALGESFDEVWRSGSSLSRRRSTDARTTLVLLRFRHGARGSVTSGAEGIRTPDLVGRVAHSTPPGFWADLGETHADLGLSPPSTAILTLTLPRDLGRTRTPSGLLQRVSGSTR